MAANYIYIEVNSSPPDRRDSGGRSLWGPQAAAYALGQTFEMTNLRLGVAGLGRGFLLTLPALVGRPDIRLTAAFDPRAEARTQFAAEFDARSFETFDQLIACADVDAVYLASPHEHHAPQAIAALAGGKHVLVEKPMATRVAEGVAMVSAARSTGKALVVGPSHGFDAPVTRAASLVRSGELGALRMITAFNFTDFMYRPRRTAELDTVPGGGGAIYNQAAHQIDVVRRIAGSPVASVRAVTGNWDPSRRVDGAYSALMTFENDACATLTYSGYGHYDSDELMGWISELGYPKDPERYGEARRTLAPLSAQEEAAAKQARGYGNRAGALDPQPAPHHEHFGFVLVSCERGDLKLSPRGIAVYTDTERRFIDIAPPERPRCEVLAEFVEAATASRDTRPDGSWGLQTLACCEALLESNRRRREIEPASLIARETETIDS